MMRLLALVAVLMLGVGALLGPIERALIYPFDATHVTPVQAGEPRLHEVTLTNNSETLIAWVAPPKLDKPVILYFHGNAGNLANRAGRFKHFLDRGYGLIAPAYRGSSGSTGTPSQDAITADTAHIFANLATLIDGLTADRVILYGESLGTGVALALASGDAAQNIAGIVLEAPYTSIPDVARALYPLPDSLLAVIKNRWNSLAHAPSLIQPLLILHGDQDHLISIEQGRQIYAAAPSRHKQFFTVKGAGHTTIWRSDTLLVMWRFIDNYADK